MAQNVDEEATNVFRSFKIATDTVSHSEKNTLEQFVVIMLARSFTTLKVDEARFGVFLRTQERTMLFHMNKLLYKSMLSKHFPGRTYMGTIKFD